MSRSLLFILLFFFVFSCKKEEVSKNEISFENFVVTKLDSRTVNISYDRKVEGRFDVVEKGLIISVDEECSVLNPRYPDSTEELNQSVSETISIHEGLIKYYFRPYLITAEDTIYGDKRSVEFGEFYVQGQGVTDVDGNFYTTVVIGDQEWMAENLKALHFCNGDPLTYLTSDSNIVFNTPMVADYDYDQTYVNDFGRLYDGEAISDERNICPCNYRVPTQEDYEKLLAYLGNSPYKTGLYLKETGSIPTGDGFWFYNIPQVNNASGMSIRPSGSAGRFANSQGQFFRFDEASLGGYFGVKGNVSPKVFGVSSSYYQNYNFPTLGYNLVGIRCIRNN